MWHSFRKALQTVHLWLALILTLPLIVIGVTGSALLAQREILAYSVPRANTDGERKPVADIIEAAQRAAPAGVRALRIDLPRGAHYPAAVRFTPLPPNTNEHEYFVDPVSLAVLGHQDVIERGPILALLIETHAFLQMPTHIGLPFVGFNGAVLTFMCLSGVVLWWPRRGQVWNAFRIRRGAKGFLLHYDLHRAAGIWGLIVLLLVSISGIYLTFPETIGGAIRDAFPAEEITPGPVPGFVPASGPINAEAALHLAETAVPQARATGVQLGMNGNPFVVDLQPQGWSPSTPPVIVLIDPATGDVAYIEDPRAYSLRERILNMQPLLHFGTGLGIVWTILVFLSGLLPALLAVTGIVMWWKRRAAKRSH